MIEIETITFACEDPDDLASFWAAATGGTRRELPPSVDPVVVDLPGEGPDLIFKDLPKGTERDLPIHFDVTAEDRAATVEELRDLGASVRETKSETYAGHEETWTVMEDPEGNGFCVTEE